MKKIAKPEKFVLLVFMSILFLSSISLNAQTVNPTSSGKSNAVVTQRNAELKLAYEELRNFKHDYVDAAGKESSMNHMKLLTEKIALLKRVSETPVSKQELTEINIRVSEINALIKSKNFAASTSSQKSGDVKKLTVNDLLISDKNSEAVKNYNMNVTYLTLDEFNQLPVEKQEGILQYPEYYRIVKDQSLIPSQTTITVIPKASLSK